MPPKSEKANSFYYKKDRLNQLRGFCAVVQNDCSLIKASEKLGLEKPAISKQISALERDLGIELFDRSKHKTLVLTKEGRLFYDEAIIDLNSIDSLFSNFNEKVKKYNNTHLNIAMHQIAASCIFPNILEKMLKNEKFKNIKINIFNISKDEAIKKLIKKELDIIYYINIPSEKIPIEIETIKSLQSRVSLIFSKNHPLSKQKIIKKEDLKNYTFLRKNIDTDTYFSTYNHFNANISNIGTIGATFETVLEIVKRTNNISTVPELFLKNNNYYKDKINFRNIDNLLNEAFFNVMVLKNTIKTEPVLWLINEFKKLK